jgi:hypothetical protein
VHHQEGVSVVRASVGNALVAMRAGLQRPSASCPHIQTQGAPPTHCNIIILLAIGTVVEGLQLKSLQTVTVFDSPFSRALSSSSNRRDAPCSFKTWHEPTSTHRHPAPSHASANHCSIARRPPAGYSPNFQRWRTSGQVFIFAAMSSRFVVKLDALGYPNSPVFNASDAQQYRTLVVFLENEKVRCLPPADRSSLLK